MAGGGQGAVFLALCGNGALTVIKFAAFLVSQSPAMLSESIHSLADTANQGLLFLGIRRSERPADARYHWGYGGERYLFALLSAVGIFVLGCGVTLYHGIHSLLHPPELSISWIVFAVLGIALVIDGVVLTAAVKEVWAKKGSMSFFRFVRTSSDPTLLAVLFEDFVATLGVIIAAIGIALAHFTGNPVFDSLSSILIGGMLGLVAIWLGWRNRELILGPAIPKDVENGVREFLASQPSIESLRQVRTRIVASDRFAFAAEIDWDGHYLGRLQSDWLRQALGQDSAPDAQHLAEDFGRRVIDGLAKEIDRIEGELRARFPRLQHLDLESDLNPDLPKAA